MIKISCIAAAAALFVVASPAPGNSQSTERAQQQSNDRRAGARSRLEDNLRAMGLPLPRAGKEGKGQRLNERLNQLESDRATTNAPGNPEKPQ